MPLGDRDRMAYERKYKPSAIVPTRFPASSETQLRIPYPDGTYEDYTDNIEDNSSSNDDAETVKPEEDSTLKPDLNNADTITDTEMEDYLAFYGPKQYTSSEQMLDPSLFST
ncbi:MAG: hypothetical protein M1836_005333 [Candelina mexicana]|nr:MAG: hypothetical protein M1836_005333 [Candelina mexicana]